MKSNREIFTAIYNNNQWGGSKGEFYSGSGSHNEFIDGYAQVLTEFIMEFGIKSIVEIGCGDFYVASTVIGYLKNNGYDNFQYLGVDIVESLVENNVQKYATENIGFVCKDSCEDDLPSADLLVIRQVLQHLDNESISKIVTKFNNYRYIALTEHQISERYMRMITPNIDKTSNGAIRLPMYSGVYVDKEPFNYPAGNLIYSILEPQGGMEAFINTYLISSVKINNI